MPKLSEVAVEHLRRERAAQAAWRHWAQSGASPLLRDGFIERYLAHFPLLHWPPSPCPNSAPIAGGPVVEGAAREAKMRRK